MTRMGRRCSGNCTMSSGVNCTTCWRLLLLHKNAQHGREKISLNRIKLASLIDLALSLL